VNEPLRTDEVAFAAALSVIVALPNAAVTSAVIHDGSTPMNHPTSDGSVTVIVVVPPATGMLVHDDG